MGSEHFEPAAARPERETRGTASRIRPCRFAKAMLQRFVPLILALWPAQVLAEAVELIGVFEWDTEAVIGISGIEITDDGAGFIAVSDRGWWVSGDFEREVETVTNVEITDLQPIIGSDGYPVSARRVGDRSDAEGLAIAPDGTAWVSFERWTRVWRFPKVFGRAQGLKDHPTFADHADNWQLEAAAIAPDGTVYVFSEKPLPEGFPIYRQGVNGQWTIEGYLPEQDVFAIVGADFDIDGSLYILERKLIVGLWWQNRIRHVRLDGTQDTILWTGERGEYGNLEGISVWRDAKGTRLTLVSDNNGNGDPTQFVEFRLTE